MSTAHFETTIIRVARVEEQLIALISDIHRTIRYFDIEIEVEEVRAGVFNLQSADYPSSARNLRARRDNLLATIVMLETAKGLHEGPTIG